MNFDAFSNTDDFREDVFFGEICVYRGYHGIKLYDIDPDFKGWQEYEPENPLHQQALATPKPNGKQRYTSLCFEVQHFPEGSSFETWLMVWATWEDTWTVFESSLAKVVNADISTKNKLGEFRNKHLRKLSEKGNYFKYETPVVRTYQKSDGSGDAKIRSIKVLEWYPDYEAMRKAFEANQNNVPQGSKMDDPKVETMPKEQALQFVASLAKQIPDTVDCWNELQKKLDEFPMLGGLKTDDEAVQKAAMDASEVFKVPF